MVSYHMLNCRNSSYIEETKNVPVKTTDARMIQECKLDYVQLFATVTHLHLL